MSSLESFDQVIPWLVGGGIGLIIAVALWFSSCNSRDDGDEYGDSITYYNNVAKEKEARRAADRSRERSAK